MTLRELTQVVIKNRDKFSSMYEGLFLTNRMTAINIVVLLTLVNLMITF